MSSDEILEWGLITPTPSVDLLHIQKEINALRESVSSLQSIVEQYVDKERKKKVIDVYCSHIRMIGRHQSIIKQCGNASYKECDGKPLCYAHYMKYQKIPTIIALKRKSNT
jgi:hypothetical protein